MVAKRKVHADKTAQPAQTTEQKATVGDFKAGHKLILLAVKVDLQNAEPRKEMQELKKVMRTETDGITSRMVQVASTFCGETFDEALFTAWAEDEETYIKSDEAGANKVDRIPRSWVQSKSNILNAWRKYKIRPDQVAGSSELNEKLNAARKAEKDAKKLAEASEANPSAAIAASVKAADKMDAGLAGRVGAIVQLFDKLTADDQDRLIKLLDVCISAAGKGELDTIYTMMQEQSTKGIAEALGVLKEDEEPAEVPVAVTH